MIAVLPDVEIVNLPSLDDEPPCKVIIHDRLCGRPATWRLSATCGQCARRMSECVSNRCRATMLAIRFPDGFSTKCCSASLVDVVWTPL